MTWTKPTTHGDARKGRIALEYRRWQGMLTRCRNPKSSRWPYYGGRGITVCARWVSSYQNFLADVGRAPSPKHSLERRDNNKGYSPDNVFWATQKQQTRNRRTTKIITYNGESLSVAAWAERLGIPHVTLWNRLERGWPIEEALSSERRRGQWRRITPSTTVRVVRQRAQGRRCTVCKKTCAVLDILLGIRSFALCAVDAKRLSTELQQGEARGIVFPVDEGEEE